MKIIYKDNIYLIPENNVVNVVCRKNQKQLIECLDMYFNKKKKGYCKILDDSDSEICNQDISLVYVPL